MNISALCIRRPVLAIVMSLVIMLSGIVGFITLGVRDYPALDPPIVSVSTVYTGADPDVIESQITEVLEASLNGIAGVRTITSISALGASTITVEFNLGEDLEASANDVRDRVSRVTRQLPQDADPPVVTKADANSTPILIMSVKSDSRNLMNVSDIARNVMKERLSTMPGVSDILIYGEKRYAMRVWMDPLKMAARGITPLDVRNALTTENVQLPSGKIEGDATELTIRTQSQLQNPTQFNNVIVRRSGNQIVRLSDVARAELGPENYNSLLKSEGIPMVGMAVLPLPGVNTVAVAEEFYKRLAELQKTLPSDIQVRILYDRTKHIKNSVSEVEETIYIAFALVFLIVFLFLRDWRSALMTMVEIPVSIIAGFFVMWVMGFSINILTLVALILAVGLVVDDAIVVLENIQTKVEQGMTPMEAAFKGSAEIYFAIISTTSTLAVVFIPVIFMPGLTGRLFREFGIVVASCVAVSGFVALTLSPMMRAYLLKQREPSTFYKWSEPFFVGMNTWYRSRLNNFLRRRWLAFVVMGGMTLLIVALFSVLQTELAPLEDKSALQLSVTAPEGTSFETMSFYMDRIDRLLQDSIPERVPGIAVTAPGFTGTNSMNSGFMRVILCDPKERTMSQSRIAEKVSRLLRPVNDVRAFPIQEPTISTGTRSSLPVQYVLQAPSFDALKRTLPKFLEEANKDKTFSIVDVDVKFNKPELKIEIDRERAKNLGVSALDITQTLALSFSGQRFGYFVQNGKQYQVVGQFDRENRDRPLDLKTIYVRNDKGELIQLDNVVRVSEQSNPPGIYHFNRYKSATVSAGLAPGKTVGDGIKAMNAIAARVLEPDFSTSLAGISKDFSESSSNLIWAFLLALLLIYLVLAAQFESFIDPFVVLLTVPLALGGAMLCLWYFNQTLNIFSEIGMIMLVGMVTKNGILIVEFANQCKERGMSKMEAAKEAAAERFRPILMTSLATALGALPIALALGAGSESRVSLGIVIVGGMLLSTGLTLFVIPAVYSYFSREARPNEAEKVARAILLEEQHAQQTQYDEHHETQQSVQ